MIRNILKFIILVTFIISSLSLYSSNTPVTLLTSQDFQKVYKGIWLVQFYAPWCGHCQRLAPQYQKAAKALKGIANIAAIDASNQRVNIQIKGYPTIKLFIDGKISEYNGDRTTNAIIDFMINQYKKIAYDRIGSKSSSGSSGSSESNDGDVIVLDDSNFDQLVLGDDNNAWFVQFYAPWCGHCQHLAPEWAALATTLKGEVKVAKVDATVNKQVASRFGVNGYPTIKFFPNGKKQEGSAIDYTGQRTQSSMAQWARQQTSSSGHYQHVQLTSQQVYDDFCKTKNLCLIAFLPHLLDSSQQERDNYLQNLKQIALKFKSKPFKFLWAQGGDHIQLEQKLGTIGIGYPLIVSIFQHKKLYGKMNKAYNSENIENFIKDILSNKAKFSKLYQLPPLKTVQGAQAKPSADSQKKQGGCGEDLCTQPPQQEPEQL